jgi:pterin-4a-carbinolamine dehydratase
MPETTITEPGSPLAAERIQGLTDRLKAERIQERLKAERIQGRPAELPSWRTVRRESALARTYGFPTNRAAAAFVALAVEIGEAAGYVPELDLRDREVTLRVATDGEEGLTELDFDVAELFERSL